MAIQSLEDFDRKTAEKRAELVLQHEISAVLGDEPDSVTIQSGPIKWVNYEVETLDEIIEALDNLQAGSVRFLDVSAIENGCTSVQPVGFHEKRYADKAPRWTVGECIELRQNSGRGFRSDEVVVHAILGGHVLRLSWRFKYGTAGLPWQLRSTLTCSYSSYGDPINVKFNEKRLGQDARIKFGSGSNDSFDLRYYFAGLDNFKAAVKPQEAAA